MLFGDESTVRPWRQDSRVQIHGPGWSKILLGEDAAAEWRSHLDLMVTSIAENGGRSCLNASGVWLPSHGRQMAEALARRLAAIEPLPLDDPAARLAAFSDPRVAHGISELIDRQLGQPGAEDLTARFRSGGRVAEVGGCTFLRPTLIYCEDADHPLAASEFLFPFAAVVELQQDRADPAHRADAGGHRDHRRPLFSGAAPRRAQHRPPESRIVSDQPCLLGPASRGQSLRASLPAAGVSGRQRVSRVA